jgi:hypothetical protein
MRHAANEAKCTSALDVFQRTNIRALRSNVSRLAGLRYRQRTCNIWAVRPRFPPEGRHPVGTATASGRRGALPANPLPQHFPAIASYYRPSAPLRLSTCLRCDPSARVSQCGGCRDLSPVRLAQAYQPCARATGNPDLPTGAEYFARRRKPRSPLADVRSAAGRKQPIVFSARCHGWCGSQKNTGVDSAAVITAWSAISRPRSPVNDRRRCVGSWPMRSINMRATASAWYPSGSATTMA